MDSQTKQQDPIAYAKRILRKVGQDFPKAWRSVDVVRESLRGPEKSTTWPDWCFMPGHVAMDVMRSASPLMPESRLTELAPLFACVAAWRLTQGVYSFDKDVLSELMATPVGDNVPVDALYELPEWSVFISTPGLEFAGKELAGLFAQLEYTPGADLLRLVMVNADDDTTVIELPITQNSIAAMVQTIEAMPASASLNVPGLMSMILFLCLERQHVRNEDNRQPRHPRPVFTKKSGWRLFAVQKPTEWLAGNVIGTRLRKTGIAMSLPASRRILASKAVPAHWAPADTAAGLPQPRWVPTLPEGAASLDSLPVFSLPSM